MITALSLADFKAASPIASLEEIVGCASDFDSPETRPSLLLRYLKSPLPLKGLSEDAPYPWLIIHYIEALKHALEQCQKGDAVLTSAIEPYCRESYAGIISAVDQISQLQKSEAISIAQVSLFLAMDRLDLAVSVVERLLANAHHPLPFWVFVHLERFLTGRLSSPSRPALDSLDEALATYVSKLNSNGYWMPLPRTFSRLVLNQKVRSHFGRAADAMIANANLSSKSTHPFICILSTKNVDFTFAEMSERLFNFGCLALGEGSRLAKADSRSLDMAEELNYGYPAVFVLGIEDRALAVDAGYQFLKTLWGATPNNQPEVRRSIRLHSRRALSVSDAIEENVDELRRIAYSVKSSF